jgi:hypothetical protein
MPESTFGTFLADVLDCITSYPNKRKTKNWAGMGGQSIEQGFHLYDCRRTTTTSMHVWGEGEDRRR